MLTGSPRPRAHPCCSGNSQIVGTIDVPVSPEGLTCADWPQRPRIQARRSYRQGLFLINQAIFAACGMPERQYIPFVQPDCIPADGSSTATSIKVTYKTRDFRSPQFAAQYAATLNSILAVPGTYECLVAQLLDALPSDTQIKINAKRWRPLNPKPQPCLPTPVVCVTPPS